MFKGKASSRLRKKTMHINPGETEEPKTFSNPVPSLLAFGILKR